MNLDLGDTRLILAECSKRGLSIPATAYILATAYWETGRTMRPVREGLNRPEEWRKGLRYYPYYGRGHVQLTHRANYYKAGRILGVDLVNDPDRALDPAISVRVLVEGMAAGWFTGKALGEYIDDAKRDYMNARRVVNGTDRAEEIAAIARAYEATLRLEKPDSIIPNMPDFDVPVAAVVGLLTLAALRVMGGRKGIALIVILAALGAAVYLGVSK